MKGPTRKQREIQERESKILSVAHKQFLQDGYHGLSMDRIAQELEYAKGTIYNHFPCKEEILAALANQAHQKRTDLFAQVAILPSGTRQRMAGVGAAAEFFARTYPHHFEVEKLIQSSSIWQKTSEKRRQALRNCESRCMEIVVGIVRDAIACGDLTLNEETRPEDIVFGLWSLSFGAYSIIAGSESLNDLGIEDPYLTVRHNMSLMIDGLNWRPLSHEQDFTPYFDELRETVFEPQLSAAAVC